MKAGLEMVLPFVFLKDTRKLVILNNPSLIQPFRWYLAIPVDKITNTGVVFSFHVTNFPLLTTPSPRRDRGKGWNGETHKNFFQS
jgi:hypothetical protein